MRYQLAPDELFKEFDLINLYELDPQEMLSSQVPEIILMAILSKSEKNNAEYILRLIIKKLKEVCHSNSERS